MDCELGGNLYLEKSISCVWVNNPRVSDVHASPILRS